MESENELQEIDIKNRTCYYFDDIIRLRYRDIDFSGILLDEKLYKEKNILIYEIYYKTSMRAKTLRIRFNIIEKFIKIHDKVRYLLLFDYSYCDKICLKSEKSGIMDSINHNFAKVRIDSYDSFPIEKNIDCS